jgi:hypothetical protein
MRSTFYPDTEHLTGWDIRSNGFNVESSVSFNNPCNKRSLNRSSSVSNRPRNEAAVTGATSNRVSGANLAGNFLYLVSILFLSVKRFNSLLVAENLFR